MTSLYHFIGRETERAELDRCLLSDRSELVLVYGRRRVGKTYLIEKHFNKEFDFWYVGRRNIPTKEQLRQFGRALSKYSGRKYDFASWFEAFDSLEDYLDSLDKPTKKLVFIDEMPWIDRVHSNFVSALEGFWNGWAMSREDIMLIATGSATSWMRDKLMENKGGLHARITCKLHIAPFTLAESEKYLEMKDIYWDRYQVMQTYMILGGVPFYYSLLDPAMSISQNIDNLFFKSNGKLKEEFDELYNGLFKFSERYIEVVRILSGSRYGMTYKELSDAVKITGGQLSKILKNLERCDFIDRWTQYGNRKRDEIMLLTDFFTRFFYKFIYSHNIREEQWWAKNGNSPAVLSWMGVCFELLCMKHHEQIKKALKLEVISTETTTWHIFPDKKSGHQGAQIDMLIERGDRIIHLCEIKFSTDKFIITRDYENKLRERMGIFRDATNNKKALVNTFITTYGVANGKNRGIVHSEVTMEDLFRN